VKCSRRRLLHLAASAVAMPAIPPAARGQGYPARPVRIVVGSDPDGIARVTAPLMAQWLSARLGQPFIIEHRALGVDEVAKAPPDGYTLLLVTTTNTINATFYSRLNFDFTHDISPVGSIFRGPLIMEINPAVPVKTVPELIAYAKANAGNVKMASAGTGTLTHVAGELFKMMTDVDMVHVPYRGGAPVLLDLLGGQLHVMFDNVSSSVEYIKVGKLRALAVSTVSRFAMLPDLPAVSEFVPGYEASAWQGIGVPKNTPVEIIDKLNKEMNAGLVDPKIRTRFAELNGMAVASSPAEFGRFMAAETAKWAKVVKFAGAKPD
jgi:tripartite-type tricarboxylate transporter receptor subunit TctC